MTAAYEVANEKANAASKAYSAAVKAYRNQEIHDEEFLAVKQSYLKAMAEFDAAYAAEEAFAQLVQITAIDQTVKQEGLF